MQITEQQVSTLSTIVDNCILALDKMNHGVSPDVTMQELLKYLAEDEAELIALSKFTNTLYNALTPKTTVNVRLFEERAGDTVEIPFNDIPNTVGYGSITIEKE